MYLHCKLERNRWLQKEGMLALLMQESSPVQLQSLAWFQQHEASLCVSNVVFN